MKLHLIGWNSGEMPRLWATQRILVKDEDSEICGKTIGLKE